MKSDGKSLQDRLYADALGADLREPAAFLSCRVRTSWATNEDAVRESGNAHQKDLNLTPAQTERALEAAKEQWSKIVPTDQDCRSVRLLSRTAKTLLQHHGREMILRVNREEPGREILRWRFVSLAVPPSILVAAGADHGLAVPAGVRLLHDSIAPDVPVAQNHVHHAAMMSFDELWESLRLRALLDFGPLVRSLRGGRATCPGLHREPCAGTRPGKERREAIGKPAKAVAHARHMAQWADTLRQAFIAGALLSRHAEHGGMLADCEECGHVARTSLRFLRFGRMRPYHLTGTPYPWDGELLALRRRWRTANAPRVFRKSQGRRFDLMERQMARERDFVRRAFAYLRPGEEETGDLLYETLFLQYLRVKTALFRLLVHPPGEPGLERFLEHFRQIKVYAPETEMLRPRKVEEPGLRIGATEYRVAPDAWLDIQGRHEAEVEIDEKARQPKRPLDGEAGWLVHFKRKDASKGLPLFGADVRAMEAEADRIVRGLTADPRRLRHLRGIDICGVEQAQPLWVSAETLRRTRRQSREVAGSRPWLRLKPLGLTVHAGEDFRWLTSGVRAVAEPFHWHLIERGDRIGHAIAVTLEPREWWGRQQGESIPVQRFDRLLDLAFLAKYAAERDEGQEKWLRAEIEKTVSGLKFPADDKTGEELVESARKLWGDLGRSVTRRLMETLDRREGRELHERWIESYLWNRSTRARAHGEIRLCVDEQGEPEVGLLEQARKKLITEVARWQVCIESNPTSNLVVGSLDAVAAQTFLQRRPTEKTKRGEEALTWTISTDDPITFSTTLADEYAYVWAGLVLAGDPSGDREICDPAYARAVLDEAARTSMRMRFTVPQETERRDR